MNAKRFAWTLAAWVVLGSLLAGTLMSLSARPDTARFVAVAVAISALRFQANAIAVIGVALGLVMGTHRNRARPPVVLALLVPFAAATSAVFMLAASSLVLRGSDLFLRDYATAVARHVDASDPLLGFMRACLCAGVLAASASRLLARLNRVVEQEGAKLFLAWLYAGVVIGAVELVVRGAFLLAKIG